MEFGVREYIAIGFPLLVGVLLAVLYPLRIKDYFSREEIGTLENSPFFSKLTLKNHIYIFIIYTYSTVLLGLVQAYLLWNFAANANPEVRFSTRFTDFIFYPFIVSALMAVFVMWFVFSCYAFSKGAQAVKEFLSRSFDGWRMMKQVGRFRYLVLIAAVVCTSANFWTYNIFLTVTDDAIVVSNHRMLGHYNFVYYRIDFFRIEWNRSNRSAKKKESFVLGFKLYEGGVVRTDLNMLYNKNMLHQIDQIIQQADLASGRNFDVVFSEFPRTKQNEIQRLFTKD